MKKLLSAILALMLCFAVLAPASVDAATIKLNKHL